MSICIWAWSPAIIIFWYYRAQGGRLRASVEDRRRRVADGVTDLASGSSFTKA
jgi:hypothetical protein